MKRPLALTGFSALAATALAAWADGSAAGPLAALAAGLGLCALLGALFCRRWNKLSAPWGARAFSVCGALATALLTAGLSLGRYAWQWQTRVAPVQILAGRQAWMRAAVEDYPQETEDHRTVYLLRVEEVRLEDRALDLEPFTARVTTWVPFAGRPGDAVEATVRFYALPEGDGLYTTRNSRLADGVVLTGSFADYRTRRTVPRASPGLSGLAAELRRRMGRGFEKLLPAEEAGLLRAMVLGERDRVPQSAEWDFRTLGVSHLLVVSGLHVSAVGGLLVLLTRRLRCRARTRRLLAGLGILLYLGVLGFPPAACRAGVLFLLTLGARSFGRRADGLNSLGAAVTLLCLARPFLGGDLGFALSVSGTAGILLLADPLAQWLTRPLRSRPRLKRALGFWVEVLAMTLAVQLTTLPLQIWVFRGLNLWTVPAGLLLALPAALLLYTGVLGALLGTVPIAAGLGEAVTFLAGLLARGVLSMAHGLSRLGGATLDLSQAPVFAAVLAVLVLLGLAFFFRRDRIQGPCLAALALVCALGSGGLLSWAEEGCASFAALPESTGVVMLRGDRAVVLCLDGERAWQTEQLLRRRNIRRVEGLILASVDADARAAAVRILERWPVDWLALPKTVHTGRDLRAAAGDTPVLFPRDGDSLSLPAGARITLEDGLRRVTVSLWGTEVTVETGDSDQEGTCTLLLTDRPNSPINSPLWVWLGGGILEEEEETARWAWPGSRVVPGEDGVLLDLFPDGTLGIRGEYLG